jgi:hypothetical protein
VIDQDSINKHDIAPCYTKRGAACNNGGDCCDCKYLQGGEPMKAIYVSDDMHERLKNEAFKRKISITALVAEKLKGGKKC